MSADQCSCQKCFYRFFPSSKTGACTPIQKTCSMYDQQTGDCLACYAGSYLYQRKCKQMDPLCAAVNIDTKLCDECYSNYILYKDQCFYKNNMKRTDDQLCEKYHNGACVECVGGTFYSRKNKGCRIQDPHCEDFD